MKKTGELKLELAPHFGHKFFHPVDDRPDPD